MPTDQVDVTQRQATSLPPATPPPTPHTVQEKEYLEYLREAMVFDREEPVPVGWKIYTTPKFLGRSALVAYLFTASSAWFANSLSSAEWIPVICTPEVAIFGLPIAVAGAWLAWTAPAEPGLEMKRKWAGRLTTIFLVYILLQTVALLFNFLWLNIFTLK